MYEKKVLDLLKKLVNEGYDVYLIGGIVRDSIIGRVSHDYDATTNATPTVIKEIYKDECIFSYGEKFGTVAIKKDEYLIEITTFRTNEEYIDNRHPSSLMFGKTLEEDVQRRDFTINALAYDVKSGETIDLVNGIKDILTKKIRCIGDPVKRFREDGLRILRAIRFSSTLEYLIDCGTKNAIKSELSCLNNISKERITEEIFKMLNGEKVNVFKDYFFVFNYLIPELSLDNFDLLNLNIDPEYRVLIRLMLLALNSKDSEKVIEYFKCENKLKSRVRSLIKNRDVIISNSVREARLLMYKLGYDSFNDLNYLNKILGKNYANDDVISEAKSLGYDLSILDISGLDIKESLKCRDSLIKEYLDIALINVINGIINNSREEILEFLKDYKRS